MNKYAVLAVVALVALVADHTTKYLAVAKLTHALEGREGTMARLKAFVTERNLDNDPHSPEGQYRIGPEHRLLDNYWHFRYVENPGAAWGLFAELPEKLRRRFFDVVSIIALVFLMAMYRRLETSQRVLQIALAMVMGGALGNYLDRLMRGYVIDFIDWHWRNQPGLRWPTFNVADAAICVGVAIMIVDSIIVGRREAKARAQAAQTSEPAADASSEPRSSSA
jgi:signal peptidase II